MYHLLNSSLDKINTYVDDEGKLHFVDATGADSVLPFKSGFQYSAFNQSTSSAKRTVTLPIDYSSMEFFSIFIGADNKEINTINNNDLITFTPPRTVKISTVGTSGTYNSRIVFIGN